MTSDSIVRMAVPADSDSLMELCRMLHAENALMEMDDAKVKNFIDCALYPKREGNTYLSMIGVVGDVGKIEAACFTIIAQMWYTNKWHVEEVFLFVRPEHRKSRHAREMVEFLKKTSHELNMPLVVGIISNHDTKRKCEFYDRLLPRVGNYYLYNGQTGMVANQ